MQKGKPYHTNKPKSQQYPERSRISLSNTARQVREGNRTRTRNARQGLRSMHKLLNPFGESKFQVKPRG